MLQHFEQRDNIKEAFAGSGGGYCFDGSIEIVEKTGWVRSKGQLVDELINGLRRHGRIGSQEIIAIGMLLGNFDGGMGGVNAGDGRGVWKSCCTFGEDSATTADVEISE